MPRRHQTREYVDATVLSLNDWLSLLDEPAGRRMFVTNRFPTDSHAEEYLGSIDSRSEEDVLNLISRFLVRSGNFPIDEIRFEGLKHLKVHEPGHYERAMMREYNRRLVKSFTEHGVDAWEGITWILDLLPDHPKAALQVLKAYFTAHIQALPDGRLHSLDDVEALIRAKFIGNPRSLAEALGVLLDMAARDFEHLVDELYRQMGYETELTPRGSDGGRDVVARRTSPGYAELVLVECKLYTSPVKVQTMRALLGVISHEKAGKGALVTTSRFTRGAKSLADQEPRLEAIEGRQLVLLLNEHLGSQWPVHLDHYVRSSQQRMRDLMVST